MIPIHNYYFKIYNLLESCLTIKINHLFISQKTNHLLIILKMNKILLYGLFILNHLLNFFAEKEKKLIFGHIYSKNCISH